MCSDLPCHHEILELGPGGVLVACRSDFVSTAQPLPLVTAQYRPRFAEPRPEGAVLNVLAATGHSSRLARPKHWPMRCRPFDVMRNDGSRWG